MEQAVKVEASWKKPNKLTTQRVRAMRRELEAGMPLQEVANAFEVTYETARMIRAGKTWQTEEAGWKGRLLFKPSGKLTDDEVREIRAEAANGRTREELAKRYAVHSKTIARIVRRESHLEVL